MTLTEIANALGCDKGTTAHEKHGYTDVYEKLIAKDGRILEIGIDKGLSVRMWRQWSPSLYIIAVDNQVECITSEVSAMCNARLCDQSNQHELDRLAESIACDNLDVIIDDGSHRPNDQLLSLNALWKCLKPGGLYFVEDLHTSRWFPRDQWASLRLRKVATEIGGTMQLLCRGKLAMIGKPK